MDYEQKYKDVIRKIQEALALTEDDRKISGLTRDCIETIFPELKKSEDEKIRKALYADIRTYIPNERGNSYIAWLEKQDEQPVDKIEPKFKVGYWVVNSTTLNLCHILKVEHGQYICDDCSFPITHENEYHLWTIQDAKDGDILAVEPIDNYVTPFVVIYANRGKDFFNSHCFISFDGQFCDVFTAGHSIDVIHPATKEQRELLFQKMEEAGWEWDSEKKELKKAEPEFHEGDWAVYNNDICQIVKREEGCNKLVTVFGIEKELVNERNLSTARLWTIQDARDGDVLVDEDNNIGLYQEEKDDLYWHSYIYIGCDGYLRGIGGYHKRKNTKPATKEQRDLLFTKMKEAGYEWDTDKKELRKINTYQLSENPCSDCTNIKGCITCVNGDQKSTSTPRMLYSDDVISWLRQHTCTACFDKPDEAISLRIDKFKEDFGL